VNSPKKLILVSYYWPPSGGVPVLRWLHLTGELLRLGWTIHLITPRNPRTPILDNKIQVPAHPNLHTHKVHYFDPIKLLGIGSKAQSSPQSISSEGSALKKILIGIRGRFFIPDARVTWVRSATRMAQSILRREKIDLVVTTGPPHSTHLVGLRLRRRRKKLSWVADFRDPWTTVAYFEHLQLSRRSLQKHQKLEREVLSSCDHLITVSPAWASELSAIGSQSCVSVVPNGYREEDFDNQVQTSSDKFTIVHAGSLGADRNPKSFWKALKYISAKNSSVRLILIGKVADLVKSSITASGLDPITEYLGQLDHATTLRWMQSADINLLLVNEAKDGPGRIPAKLFEYLRAGAPILSISPHVGDAARILSDTSAGRTFSYASSEQSALEDHLTALLTKPDRFVSDNSRIEIYSRRRQAQEIDKIFARLLES